MPRPITSNRTKSARLRGLLAATLIALMGIFSTGISATAPSRTWSVYVHIQYPNGFVYENAFAVGVPTSELPSILAECGRSHRFGTGSAIHYHCFPQPE